MKKPGLLQYAYDLFCFAAVACLCNGKNIGGAGYLVGVFILLLLLPFASSNEYTGKISFVITHAFIAWLAWTFAITFYLTAYLYDHVIESEHSIWDVFAVLIPFILTGLTIWYDLKHRVYQKWYEPFYLFIVAMACFAAPLVYSWFMD